MPWGRSGVGGRLWLSVAAFWLQKAVAAMFRLSLAVAFCERELVHCIKAAVWKCVRYLGCRPHQSKAGSLQQSTAHSKLLYQSYEPRKFNGQTLRPVPLPPNLPRGRKAKAKQPTTVTAVLAAEL